jgi:DNA polymerase-1
MPYLASHKWKKIIQQGKFEGKFIKYFYNTRLFNIWDTLMAEKVLFPDMKRASLEYLAKKYLDRDLDKSVRKSFVGQSRSVFTEKQITYAAEDVEILFPIMEQQKIRAEEQNLMPILDIEFRLSPIVGYMENTGIPVDVPLWRSRLVEFQELHEKSRLEMHKLLFDSGKNDEQMGMFTRDSINLGSPKQLKSAFSKIGIDVDSTNEKVIALIDNPAARELLNFRGLEKIMTSYGESSFIEKIHPFTNRLHPDFQQMGTETGRFSCKEPNMQQLPERFRSCIRDTNSEYMIVGADYSQMELRIIAEMSDDPNLIKAFTTGDDLHKATAAMMFNLPLEQVSKHQRFIAKTINFGVSYGMQVKKLMDTLNKEAYSNNTTPLKFGQTKKMFDRYHAIYRVATGWLDESGAIAYRRGFSETMLGRKRFYTRPDINAIGQDEFEKQVAAIRRQGGNSPIQGTNADITKIAMIDIYNELEDAGYRADMIIQVHDEVVVLARKDQAEAVKLVVEDSMRKAAEQVITKVPVKVDSYVDSAWKK